MWEFLGGLVVGAGAIFVKDAMVGGQGASNSKIKLELKDLYEENEKFRQRAKELQRKVEDLQIENRNLKNSNNSKSDNVDDLKDDLEDARIQIKKLEQMNDELSRKVREYKHACDEYASELSNLKK